MTTASISASAAMPLVGLVAGAAAAFGKGLSRLDAHVGHCNEPGRLHTWRKPGRSSGRWTRRPPCRSGRPGTSLIFSR